ncbi:probable trehalase [Typha angustifolia]|uniref:probable trehalase n=1 Tax=Typha angustifolia TaxID=59011 RepID=UPI003C2DAC48
METHLPEDPKVRTHSSPILSLSLSFSFMLFSTTMASSSVVYAVDPLVSFLQRLQSDALKTLGPADFDPKLYVDLPLKNDLSATEAAFTKLPRVNGAIPAADLERFVEEYFDEAGSDLVHTEPVDFVAEPEGFLPKVENPKVRAWALEVHALWRNLSRRVADEVRRRPERHTLLPLPEMLFIPGSRFREVYYWDSYWVIRGLLASKMYDSAKAIVHNLVSLLEHYGHVLNGARTYYSNRSQPPLLSSMILDIFMRTNDLAFVKKVYPSLLKEYNFWMSDVHKVIIRDVQGHNHCLNRYQAMWNKPRPESAIIDEESASKLLTASQKENFYHQLASAAESGWDFSSRWMSNSSDLTTLATTSIIPVDLNTFLYKMELDIAVFAKLVGDNSTSEKFFKALKARQAAIASIFWNSNMEQWLDYRLINRSNCEEVYQWQAHYQNTNIFASNFIPLWTKAYGSELDTSKRLAGEKILKSLQRSGLIHAAGIATSLSNTEQQWDFPNGWAPLQHLIVQGLANCGSKEARSLAENIAIRWIRTNYAAFRTTGAMHEKYNVEACGKIGGGGEYKPQTGFGWSNGVVLAFLEEFGWPHDRDIDCQL